jgi:hypothetical protein
MNLLQDYDWKKLAQTQTAPDEEIEKAFMDQAYATIQNKARPIMQAPYRLGFEIVYKNDNNTRMVGIFAFRIQKNLYYAPVFFLNGEIKGTDLLYRHETKTFVPLTEEWVRYLLESSDADAGGGVERRFTTSIQQHFNINKLKAPTIGLGKSASAEPDYKAAWADLAKTAGKKLEPVLKNFILEDGGVTSVEKIATAMEHSFDFAKNLCRLVPETDFAPVELNAEKKASAPTPNLVLHRGPYNPGIKCASESYMKDGFWLEDMRKEAEVATVFEDASVSEFKSPDEAGLYEVVLKGGDVRKLFVVRQNTDSIPPSGDIPVPSYPLNSWSQPKGYFQQPYLLWDPETKEALESNHHVMGRLVEPAKICQPEKEDKLPEFMKESMETGKAYLVYDTASQTASPLFYVSGKRTVDGVVTYTVRPRFSSERQLVHNKDYTQVKLKEAVVGSNARFIEVKSKPYEDRVCESVEYPCNFSPGSQADVTTFLLKGGIKFASVKANSDGELRVRLGDRNETVAMSKVAAVVYLAKNLSIHADVATKLVGDAETKGLRSFCFEKPASALMLQAEPQFDPQLDPMFNTLVDPQPKYTVGTDFQPEQLPPQRIGDAWDPTMMRNVLQTAGPNELAQISQKGAPHIFEHGVVGELVKTYDAAAMIQKYVPKMEDALDCLGRLLFLLYWKPDDFQSTYGSDDLANKENEILSNFKSFGDLLLDLLKQTKPERTGSVSMGM